MVGTTARRPAQVRKAPPLSDILKTEALLFSFSCAWRPRTAARQAPSESSVPPAEVPAYFFALSLARDIDPGPLPFPHLGGRPQSRTRGKTWLFSPLPRLSGKHSSPLRVASAPLFFRVWGGGYMAASTEDFSPSALYGLLSLLLARGALAARPGRRWRRRYFRSRSAARFLFWGASFPLARGRRVVS